MRGKWHGRIPRPPVCWGERIEEIASANAELHLALAQPDGTLQADMPTETARFVALRDSGYLSGLRSTDAGPDELRHCRR